MRSINIYFAAIKPGAYLTSTVSYSVPIPPTPSDCFSHLPSLHIRLQQSDLQSLFHTLLRLILLFLRLRYHLLLLFLLVLQPKYHPFIPMALLVLQHQCHMSSTAPIPTAPFSLSCESITISHFKQ